MEALIFLRRKVVYGSKVAYVIELREKTYEKFFLPTE